MENTELWTHNLVENRIGRALNFVFCFKSCSTDAWYMQKLRHIGTRHNSHSKSLSNVHDSSFLTNCILRGGGLNFCKSSTPLCDGGKKIKEVTTTRREKTTRETLPTCALFPAGSAGWSGDGVRATRLTA